jgi:hypothetical protein
MPDRSLPARPSLDQLRTQAKELLRRFRAEESNARHRFLTAIPRLAASADAAPVLADAQFVIARELGFEDWAALKRHLETRAASDRVAQYESIATDFLAAHQGDESAAGRLSALFHVAVTSERVRQEIQRRLAPLRGESDGDLTQAEAQLVVARLYGFDDWEALTVAAARSASVLKSGLRSFAAPPCCRYDEDRRAIEVRPPLSDRDWDAVIEAIRTLRVGRLDAAGQMTDAVLARLVRIPHLIELNLAGSRHVTDAGLRAIGSHSAIRLLNLSGTGVTDRGLEALADLAELRSIAFAHHRHVSDRGIANLASCGQLEFVDLMGTPTGDGAIRALSGKPTLRRLYAGNEVTDAGLALLHGFPAFKRWLGGDVAFELGAFEADPTYLFLNMRTPFTDAGLAALIGLDGLFAVNFFATTGFAAFDDSHSKVTADGVAHMSRLPNLGWLGCCARLGSDQAMRHVAALPRLRMLFGQDMIAGDDGFSELSRSSSIECINGRRCYGLGTRGFAALAAMPALRGLSMSCRNVADEGFAALPRFPSLRELAIWDVPDGSYRHVGRCPRLETLSFGRDATDTAIAHIAELSTLKHVALASTAITDRALEVLATLTSLEKIDLRDGRGVTGRGLARLAALPSLRAVSLGALPHVTRADLSPFPPQVRITFSID